MSESLLPLFDFLAALEGEHRAALAAAQNAERTAEAAFAAQAQEVERAFEAVEKSLPDLKALLPIRFGQSFSLRTDNAFRFSQTPEALADWYNVNLEEPVQRLALSALVEAPSLSPAQTGALVHEARALRDLAALRDLGLFVYAHAEALPQDMARLRALASSCLAREKLFTGLADENLRQLTEACRAGAQDRLRDMDEILRQIKTGQGKGFFAQTPPARWLEITQGALETRRKALRETLSDLMAHGSEMALLAAPGQALDSDVEHAFEALEALPLMKGLSAPALRSLLRGAHLLDVDKGESFLTQGQPVTRFFIVMDGWVKLFKTTPDGVEAVLQIAGRKDCVLETPFLSPSLAAVGGKAASKARLLSLSAAVLRDALARNRELAQNLLAASAARLHKLVAHFEQITLRDAQARVGWFLANLYVETGLQTEPLVLPFDKALIASYLGITPETFSRALSLFKKQGFKIEKNRVVLPDRRALCAYCDPDMALRCCRAAGENCPPFRAAQRREG